MKPETPVTKNTGEILRAAAARVRQGWCQHVLTDDDGGVCAMGALNVCGHGYAHYAGSIDNPGPLVVAWGLLARAIGYDVSDNWWSQQWDIVNWNNAKGQTAENVAAGLELAAILWEQEQAQAIGEAQSAEVSKG